MARRRRPDVLTHPRPEATKAAQPAQSPGPILSLDEIADLYPEERILLRITAYDEDKIPSHGEVVGHWPWVRASDPLVSEALSRALDETDDCYFLFQAVHYIRSGEEMRKALEELSRSDEVPRGRWF
jgi:hypothetical protein